MPKVVQYTVHGSYGERKVANVLAYEVDTTGSTMDRPTAVYNMGGVLLNEWDDSILPNTNSLYKAESVSWIDLNSSSGVVGARTTSGAHVWPKAGGSNNASMPGNVARLVIKNVDGIRGAKRGRMYLAGVEESETFGSDQNRISTAVQALWAPKLTAFLGDTNQTDPGVTTYQSHMVVIHVTSRQPDSAGHPNKLPLTGIGLHVTSLALDPLLATQRRRLRG